jgi:catechol 2,3-dioxygenase-like lactoylglutathione lyase family enzyme
MALLGINHITLAVRDLGRSFVFYRDVLGLKPLCRWDLGAYFLCGEFWFCLNLDKTAQPDIGYTHYAFSVAAKDFKSISERIINSGAKIFQPNSSEGDSLYFLDPDGYKLEIHVGDWRSRVAAKKEQAGNWKNIEWFDSNE